MKTATRSLLLIAWIVSATLVHARIWVTHADLFPSYPEWVGLRISDIVESWGPAGVEDITLWYVLGISFLHVVLASALAALAFAGLRKLGRLNAPRPPKPPAPSPSAPAAPGTPRAPAGPGGCGR